MLIETMPQVLTWRGGDEVRDRVHSAYLATLADALAGALRRAGAEDPAVVDPVMAAVRSLPDEALARVLVAPEVSNRLLWPGGREAGAIATFLLDALRAEGLRSGTSAGDPPPGGWTATGDARVLPGRAVDGWPQVPGLPPLDFGSPHALAVDLSGADRDPPPPRRPFSDDERARLLTRLTRVAAGIAAAGDEVAATVCAFNTVLVLQPDPEAPTAFSSGSNGRYIGRSFLANPHVPGVDEAMLADAIVHEAIHGLLYMQEHQRAWVSDPELLLPTPRVRSPWSGRDLPARPFLQACFVWYGLLHFWVLALETEHFPPGDVRRHIATAATGFIAGSLTDLVAPWEAGVAPELLEAIDVMQRSVCDAFAGVA